jgi:RNA polymerase sigma-32 factor
MAQIEDVSSGLVRRARNAPFLEREEEQALAWRWKNDRDEKALHVMTLAHMRLVMAIASRFRHYGLPVAELVQEGHIGLMEAAARFDPDREVRFSTYATWWIRASIQDYILRNWCIVRGGTSSAQKSLFFNLRRLRARLALLAPNESSVQMFKNIALALGVSPGDVETMNARLSAPDTSLNAPISGDDDGDSAERGELLMDDSPTPDIVVAERIDGERRIQSLKQAMDCLNPREMRILRARRLAEEAATLETLGAELGISKERVRQIENRALEKLKHAMAHQNGDTASSAWA